MQRYNFEHKALRPLVSLENIFINVRKAQFCVCVCFIVYRALWWQVRRTKLHTNWLHCKRTKQLCECSWPLINHAVPRIAALRTSTRSILFASPKEKAVLNLQIDNHVTTLKTRSKNDLVISFTNDPVLSLQPGVSRGKHLLWACRSLIFARLRV